MTLLREEKINLLSDLLSFDLIKNGILSVIFVDLAGNVLIETYSDWHKFDSQSLASLGAGNFLAVSTLLNYLEDTELTLLFLAIIFLVRYNIGTFYIFLSES